MKTCQVEGKQMSAHPSYVNATSDIQRAGVTSVDSGMYLNTTEGDTGGQNEDYEALGDRRGTTNKTYDSLDDENYEDV